MNTDISDFIQIRFLRKLFVETRYSLKVNVKGTCCFKLKTNN